MVRERSDPVLVRARAAYLIDLDRPKEALRLLYALLAGAPDDAETICLTAQAELAAGRPSQAFELAARAAAQDPADAWSRRLGALALSAMNKHPAAVTWAEQAVALHPDAWEGHVVAAQVAQLGVGQGRLALRHAEQAIAIAPNEATTHLVLGQVLLAQERPDDAEAALRIALRIDPQNAGAMNELGRVAIERVDIARSVEHFTQALHTDPGEPAAVANLRGLAWAPLWLVQATTALLLLGASPFVFGVALGDVPVLWGHAATFALMVSALAAGRLLWTPAARRLVRQVFGSDRGYRWAVALLGLALALLVTLFPVAAGRPEQLVWGLAVAVLAASALISLVRHHGWSLGRRV